MDKEDTEFEWCICGLPLGHKGKCLSQKIGGKEKIGKWSGKSKSKNAYNEYK